MASRHVTIVSGAMPSVSAVLMNTNEEPHASARPTNATTVGMPRRADAASGAGEAGTLGVPAAGPGRVRVGHWAPGIAGRDAGRGIVVDP